MWSTAALRPSVACAAAAKATFGSRASFVSPWQGSKDDPSCASKPHRPGSTRWLNPCVQVRQGPWNFWLLCGFNKVKGWILSGLGCCLVDNRSLRRTTSACLLHCQAHQNLSDDGTFCRSQGCCKASRDGCPTPLGRTVLAELFQHWSSLRTGLTPLCALHQCVVCCCRCANRLTLPSPELPLGL